MIFLGTLVGLLEHHHRLDAYCLRCDRWAEIGLAAMVAADLGDRRLPLRVGCRECSELGRLQVRPPVPTRPDSVGWISVPARQLGRPLRLEQLQLVCHSPQQTGRSRPVGHQQPRQEHAAGALGFLVVRHADSLPQHAAAAHRRLWGANTP
jgi:hypothetical protein